MLYKNGLTVLPDFTIAEADVRVSKGRIIEIVPRGAISDSDGEIDISGRILAPGFIDMHIHGCCGADFSSDGDTSACLDKMSEFLHSRGIAAFAPAAMTMPYDELCSLMIRYQKATVNPRSGAIPAGIYLEGPFLSAVKCGAQQSEYIQPPDFEKFEELYRLSGENIRVACVAPETDGAVEFIRQAAEVCRVSAAHTAADYDTMRSAIEAGISNATHLYNGMNSITHREPNGAAALLESGSFCELICDGIHVHPAMIRLTYRLIGCDRLCIVSDSMSAAGLGDGEFKLGGQKVLVSGSRARLADGRLAGAVATAYDGFRNAVKFGIPPLDALRAVTINPARALGIDNILGSIAVGKSAKMILLDENFNFAGNA
ncbi:MAG: N-acetylglucosamine-6-phosphate deacetylase [Acutalibacteraceae bacterium]